MIRHLNAPTLVEVANTCGVSELLAGGVSECTILDLQDSLLNSGSLSNSSAPQHRNTTNTLLRLTEVLRQGEAASPQLRSLVLSGLPLADDGAAMLAPAFPLHPSLFAVRMDSCGIGPRGAEAIASALTSGAAVRSLSLSWNAVGAAGACAHAFLFKDLLPTISSKGLAGEVAAVTKNTCEDMAVNRIVCGTRALHRMCPMMQKINQQPLF